MAGMFAKVQRISFPGEQIKPAPKADCISPVEPTSEKKGGRLRESVCVFG
jgi:hypothetical protein